MAVGVIEIEYLGQKQVVSAISRFGEYLKLSRPEALQSTADYLQSYFRRRFASQGPGWAPLSPGYAAWKNRFYPGRGILVLTGAMRTAIADQPRREIRGDALWYAPNPPHYTWYHQYGTSMMPARKLIQLSQQNRFEIVKIFQSWAVKKAREAGL